jgi:hypothetical protein
VKDARRGDASNIHPHLWGIKNNVPTLTSQGIDKNLAKTGVFFSPSLTSEAPGEI